MVPVSTTASVGIINTKSTADIDKQMSTRISMSTSNRFNSYLIIYKESSPFIYYVLPRGQKTTSYNEFIDPPKMINIVVVLMIRMDYGMSARFVVKYIYVQ